MKTPFILAAVCLFAGCRQTTLREVLEAERATAQELSFEAGNHRIEVRLVSRVSDLLARSGLPDGAKVDRGLLDSLAEASGGFMGHTFVMRIGPKDTVARQGFANDLIYGPHAGYADHREALQAFQTGLREKIWLEIDGRRVPLANYQMENNFGAAPGRTFILLFPRTPGSAGRDTRKVKLVMDDVVPGLGRKKTDWLLQAGKYEQKT